MAQRITNLKILDAWMATEPDGEVRRSVIESIVWISENLNVLRSRQALPGAHPLRREILTDEGILIRVVLTTPSVGAHLLSIEPIDPTWDGS